VITNSTFVVISEVMYIRRNSTKFQASGAGNFRFPKPMSRVRKVREFVCEYISVRFCSHNGGGAIIRPIRCDLSSYALRFVRLALKDSRKITGTFWR
jgi:hypothetical protein